MLTIEKLTRRFSGKAAVHGVSPAIESGSFTGIMNNI